MGILKSKRKESQLFVYDTYRRLATELLTSISECLSAERFKNLNDFKLRLFDREIFHLQDDLHNIANEILQANAIFPTNESEYEEKRIHETAAIGYCFSIQNDIISIFDLEPEYMKRILHIANDFQKLEGLLKKWRKAIKKGNSLKSRNPSNFCNVNNNGNSNNNNYNNVNGVRPDLV